MTSELETPRLRVFLKFVSECVRLRGYDALFRLLAQRAHWLLKFRHLTIVICDEHRRILSAIVIKDHTLRELSTDQIPASEMEFLLDALATGATANGSYAMCAPMISAGRTIGAMSYASTREQYSDHEVDLAGFLAECLAGTFERLAVDDAMRKPLDAVIAAVDALEVSIEATKEVSLRMSYLAQHDALTSLPNRWLLTERLAQAVALSSRYSRHMAVIFMDIDKFKQINDSLGHEIGDQVLRQISHRLEKCVRSSDTVSRIGGDEFVVLLAELVEEKDVSFCAAKIIEAVTATLVVDNHELHLKLSIGVGIYPRDGQDVETLIRSADTAMYHSKAEGHGKCHFFTQSMVSTTAEKRVPEIAGPQ